ncbi:hypothetical protein [Robertmurraya massiliosenegalensis]|uniref:hypothetical protein n=1 Tax=Robertmurraya massiliosenegalensis TaxID=1287657 RepID=UPI0012B56607|nr:hypothetical protein [Robertmurraya massiliosenegalensis]
MEWIKQLAYQDEKITGKIPLNEQPQEKKAEITGNIPAIPSKNAKINDFALHKRKIFRYFA